uniref:Transmembrane protein n=1 Tax=Chenopodium quinoa TaxID=63459 RepID=A0A803LZL8_CHEQI
MMKMKKNNEALLFIVACIIIMVVSTNADTLHSDRRWLLMHLGLGISDDAPCQGAGEACGIDFPCCPDYSCDNEDSGSGVDAIFCQEFGESCVAGACCGFFTLKCSGWTSGMLRIRPTMQHWTGCPDSECLSMNTKKYVVDVLLLLLAIAILLTVAGTGVAAQECVGFGQYCTIGQCCPGYECLSVFHYPVGLCR